MNTQDDSKKTEAERRADAERDRQTARTAERKPDARRPGQPGVKHDADPNAFVVNVGTGETVTIPAALWNEPEIAERVKMAGFESGEKMPRSALSADQLAHILTGQTMFGDPIDAVRAVNMAVDRFNGTSDEPTHTNQPTPIPTRAERRAVGEHRETGVPDEQERFDAKKDAAKK